MPTRWSGSDNLVALLAAVALLLVLLGGGVRLLVRRHRGASAQRHVPDPSWTPVVHELVARGVTAPDLLVFTLANYDLELGSASSARVSLPCAAATVAQTLERPLSEVQAALVDRAAGTEEAERLLQDLRRLRPRLEGLPGVTRIGEPWPADAALLHRALRRYARMSGLG